MEKLNKTYSNIKVNLNSKRKQGMKAPRNSCIPSLQQFPNSILDKAFKGGKLKPITGASIAGLIILLIANLPVGIL